MLRILSFVSMLLILSTSAHAALMLGLLDDFEDGTLGGWSPPRANTANVAGGPAGSTRFLEIRSSPRLSAFDAGVNGAIDPAVQAIEVDLFRPAGLSALEIRLVLFGPGTGNRWTSTNAQVVPSDGAWQSYIFSILESDLTQVAGANSFAQLSANLNRIMFRHDAGGPSAQGTPVASNFGSFGIDNVFARGRTSTVPIPASVWLLGVGLAGLARHRVRR